MSQPDATEYTRRASSGVSAALRHALINFSSQSELAAYIGINPRSLMAYISRDSLPSTAQCLRICDVLGISIQEMLDPEPRNR